METKQKITEKISQSITLKAFVIGFLSLLLLIPGFLVQDLIRERQQRSDETILKINDKWSQAQTLTGPVLVVPYTVYTTDNNKKQVQVKHNLYLAPEQLNYDVKLFPEVRHFSIYKTILYNSDIKITGNFPAINLNGADIAQVHWDETYIRLGLSDLRGVSSSIDFEMNGKHMTAGTGNAYQDAIGNSIIIWPDGKSISEGNNLKFNCTMKLKGSSNINFVPMGKTTQVKVSGAWQAPGFTGSFSPDYQIDKNGFAAQWTVLHFNRAIPERWIDNTASAFVDTEFGVNLVDTIDHYQQNMRSAKYAILFIGLTFLLFFFVELITRKRIHPVQYLLVGLALILFYSLLLSLSEQIGFGWAYISASVAIIALITSYSHSIFKNRIPTAILGLLLTLLYIFLYVVLQLENVALLIGSIGLFVILAIIMYFSKRITWYKPTEDEATQE